MLNRFLGKISSPLFAFLVVERGQDQCWPVIEFDPVLFPVIKLVMNDLPASFLFLIYFLTTD
jgi:hypothetical protein